MNVNPAMGDVMVIVPVGSEQVGCIIFTKGAAGNAFTVIVNVVVAAHCPAFGVNV